VFTPAEEAAMVGDYQRGTSVAELARRHGCSFRPVHRVLQEHGVHEPGRSRVGLRFTVEERNDMVQRYADGQSIYAIARRYDVSPNGIWKTLKALNVEFRDNAWRGGRIAAGSGGRYVAVLAERDDPIAAAMANVTGYVLEHRLVMARSLGRALRPDETVHHVNGEKADNRLENLQLRQGKHGKGARFTCMDCGSHNVEPSTI
jgi:transposase-like protein